MEENVNKASGQASNKPEGQSEELSELMDKVNVDQAAIDEARAAVGNDLQKIKEYLINNRGL